jgi:hypothetical protein
MPVARVVVRSRSRVQQGRFIARHLTGGISPGNPENRYGDAVADTGDCLNDFLLAKHLPQLGYSRGERCVDDHNAGPHGLQDLFFADYLPRPGEQEAK